MSRVAVQLKAFTVKGEHVNGYSMRHRIGLTIGLWLVASQGVARAQTATDKAAAESLLNEGRKPITKGDATSACALFEASLNNTVQLVTQFALASCYETLGKTASVWSEFRAVASTASKAHDRRLRLAEEHVAALEPRLSKLMLRLEPGYRVDGLEVKRDGAVISAAELGTPVPVGPIDHTIEASAPGRGAWSNKVSVVSSSVLDVVVSALRKASVQIELPGPKPACVMTKPPEDTARLRRLIAYGTGAGGVGLIDVSLIFGAIINSRWADAQNHCRQNQCDATGVDLAHGAQTMGQVSTGVFVAGAAAVPTGAALYLTARSSEAEKALDPTTLRVMPGVATAQGGLTLQGGF